MTAQDVITLVDSVKPNPFDQTTKLSWINEVEGIIYENLMKSYKSANIQLQSGVSSYALPNDCKFDFINSVIKTVSNCAALDIYYSVPGVVSLNKIDARSVNQSGYYQDSSNIAIYPTPTQDDDINSPSLKIVYTTEYTDKALTDTLQVSKPYDNIYANYLYSKIDWFNEEYANYNNSLMLYNANYDDLSKWYNNNAPSNNYQVQNIW